MVGINNEIDGKRVLPFPSKRFSRDTRLSSLFPKPPTRHRLHTQSYSHQLFRIIFYTNQTSQYTKVNAGCWFWNSLNPQMNWKLESNVFRWNSTHDLSSHPRVVSSTFHTKSKYVAVNVPNAIRPFRTNTTSYLKLINYKYVINPEVHTHEGTRSGESILQPARKMSISKFTKSANEPRTREMRPTPRKIDRQSFILSARR